MNYPNSIVRKKELIIDYHKLYRPAIIADKVGCSRVWVYYVLKAAGLKPKKGRIAKKKIIIIDRNNTDGNDEIYCLMYKCEVCDFEWITADSNYCSQCGVKIKWTDKK